MSKTPKFVEVKTPFSEKELKKATILPVTKTKKVLWGFWSTSETEILYFTSQKVYKVEPQQEQSK